ncbi:Cholinesterase [Nymphon striatum]|nr:Cholinesterase [Nymphon striatum]
MNTIICSVFLWSVLALVRCNESNFIVETSNGLVRGTLDTNTNPSIATFLGIPFAEPPIGSRRFSRPERIGKWKGVYNATEYKSDCMELPISSTMSEDCLYLNIWAAATVDLKPVFVYIHGGGFTGGTARQPGLLLSTLTSAVVVSISYRLNAFGFLNLNIKEAPGNMGLLDQQMALEWVKNNVKDFGGNSNDITIFGMSAGGASVGYHLLSPRSQNYFNRAAMHSGSPNDRWGFNNKNASKAITVKLAAYTNCSVSDVTLNPKRLVKCLKQVSPKVIAGIRSLGLRFVPTVDNYFILDSPQRLLSQGKFKKTDIIIGTDKDDGSSFLPGVFHPFFMHGFPTPKQIMIMVATITPNLSRKQTNAIINMYSLELKNSTRRNDTIKVGNMATDVLFLCPSLDFSESYNKFGGRAFYYRFMHRKEGSTGWVDVPHVSDKNYIFGTVQQSQRYTKPEKELSQRLISQWLNLATVGNPSLTYFNWSTYGEENKRYYKINIGKPEMASEVGEKDSLKVLKLIAQRSPELCYLQISLSTVLWIADLLELVRCKGSNVIVDTSNGIVRGTLVTNTNPAIATFLGIPFSEPPIGSRRFSRPERIGNWKGVYNATEYKSDCMKQPISSTMSEDCLYLNIWAAATVDLKPVFVYIHGGGFTGGTARQPGLLLSTLTNTVVVSISYRLNAFGFLNLNIKEAPGNMGLLDQQMALEWVKNNVKDFGGNSNDITIFGMSAGGASVGYHLLSPRSQNYFNRAAMHSGSPNDRWGFNNKNSSEAAAVKLAAFTNCSVSDVTLNPKRLVKCLKQLSPKVIAGIRSLGLRFVPTVDNYFISDSPQRLLSQGKFKKTDVIIGTDKDDGSSVLPGVFHPFFMHGFPTPKQIMIMVATITPNLSQKQTNAIINMYSLELKNATRRNDTIKVGNMATDVLFLCPSLDFSESYNKFGGRAFYYQFMHRKEGSTSWIDVPHVSDKNYIFGTVQQSQRYTKPEKELSQRLISQWLNLATQPLSYPHQILHGYSYGCCQRVLKVICAYLGSFPKNWVSIRKVPIHNSKRKYGRTFNVNNVCEFSEKCLTHSFNLHFGAIQKLRVAEGGSKTEVSQLKITSNKGRNPEYRRLLIQVLRVSRKTFGSRITENNLLTSRFSENINSKSRNLSTSCSRNPSLTYFNWSTYGEENKRYYKINIGKPEMASGPRTEFCQFWKNLKNGREPLALSESRYLCTLSLYRLHDLIKSNETKFNRIQSNKLIKFKIKRGDECNLKLIILNSINYSICRQVIIVSLGLNLSLNTTHTQRRGKFTFDATTTTTIELRFINFGMRKKIELKKYKFIISTIVVKYNNGAGRGIIDFMKFHGFFPKKIKKSRNFLKTLMVHPPSYYIMDSLMPFEEDEIHEFKGHRTICAEDLALKHKGNAANRFHRTRCAISRTICGFLNTGKGGTIYMGVSDDGYVKGIRLTQFQVGLCDHVELSLKDLMGRYTPPVFGNQITLHFVPVLELEDVGINDQQDFNIGEITDLVNRYRPHSIRDCRFCWCDQDGMAKLYRGVLSPLYVIEIKIAAWTKLGLHPIYENEEGKALVRKQASVTEEFIENKRGWKELPIERTGDLDGRPLLSSGPIWADDDDDDEKGYDHAEIQIFIIVDPAD